MQGFSLPVCALRAARPPANGARPMCYNVWHGKERIMSSLSRRTFVGLVGAQAVGPWLRAGQNPAPRKKIAVVTTIWNYRSHAWHMAERFLAGFPLRGRWYRPAIDVVSAY